MNQELEGDWPQVEPDQLPQVYLQCLFELIFNVSQLAGDDGDVALQEAAEIAAEQVINYVCSLWKHIQVG